MAAIIERDMAVTVEDFRRTVPIAAKESFRAIGVSGATAIDYADSAGNTGDAGCIIVADCRNRRVTFTLAIQDERDLGALRLPSTRVRIGFDGFSGDEAARFLACFDAYFRRGGG